jgi:hypothetical protein
MGRSTTPEFVVEMREHDGGRRFTPQAWRVKGQHGIPGDGKPTKENLERFVKKFEESTEPGGANSHLGPTRIVYARIRQNCTGGATVAEYIPHDLTEDHHRTS